MKTNIAKITRRAPVKEQKQEIKQKISIDVFSDLGIPEEKADIIRALNYDSFFYTPIMFEIGTVYKVEGFEALMDRLRNSDPKNSLSFVNQGIMEQENRASLDLERSSRKGEMEITDGVPCDKCKSTNTQIRRQQTRSADEGISGFRFCLDCKTQKRLG